MSDQPVKAQVSEAVRRSIDKYGTPAWDKARILKPFAGQAARSTLYRWIDEAVAEHRPAARAIKAARKAAKKGAILPDAEAAATEVALSGALVPSGEMLAGALEVRKMVVRLEACMVNCEDVFAHSRTPEGRVRLAKTLMQATDNMRRTIEAATKLHQTLMASGEVERFKAELVATIRAVAAAYPEASRVLLSRIQELSGRWA
jgi:hypothetical protein